MQHKLNKKLMLVPAIASAMFFSTVSLSAETPPNVLGNDYLRFGNTLSPRWGHTQEEDSVTSTGSLLQPYYYDTDAETWYQLTYRDYPLDIGVAVGGDGTNNWNDNGTLVETDDGDFDDAIQNQSIDYSAYVKQESNVTTENKGYGAITSTIDLAIDDYDLEMKNTYELGENNSYIKITTTVTNIGTETADNLRVWVGTRDDWVGTNDDPTKTRGNIVDGNFVPLTDPAQQSLALTIVSEDTGVLFYSTTATMYMVQEECCSFSNVIEQDPATSLIVAEDDDGAYGLFVRMDDLAIGESETFTWFYGAGPIETLTDLATEIAAAANSSVTVREDGTVDLGDAFSDSNDNQYPLVKITLLPENGVLTLFGDLVVADQEVSLDDFDNLIYTPNPDYFGQDLFKWIGYSQVDGDWVWSDEADVVFTVERTLNNEIPVAPEDILKVSIQSTGIVNAATGEYAGGAGTFELVRELTPEQTADIPADVLENILTNSGIDFHVTGDDNMSLTVTFTLNDDQEGVFASYWKYGPVTLGGPDRWYDLGSLNSNNGNPATSGVGYEILDSGRTMKVTFVDGLLGDDDFTVNGEIIDPGFPVILGPDALSDTRLLDYEKTKKTVDHGGSFSLFSVLSLLMLILVRRKQFIVK